MPRARSNRAGYRSGVTTFFATMVGLGVSTVFADEPAMESPTHQDDLYVQALSAWNLGHASTALDLSRDAIAAGPPHAGARLLEGYALVRLSRVDDALPVFAELALDPFAEPKARILAERAWRQRADRRSRNGVSASVGAQLWFRPYGGTSHSAVGYSLNVGIPVADMFGVRLDAALNDDFADSLLEGPTTTLMFTAEAPFTTGVFHWGVGTGPASWFLTGPLEPDGGTKVEIGLHSAVWVNARCWRSAGFALELGGYSWPQMAPDLVAYMFTWDSRLSFVAWFGPGNRRAIPRPT